MKLKRGEVAVPQRRLEELLRKERAHDDYRRAIEYMTGYMAMSRSVLERSDLTPTVSLSMQRARMSGRIEAMAAFDLAIIRAAAERVE